MGKKQKVWEQIEKLSALSLCPEERKQMEEDMEEIDAFLSVLNKVQLEDRKYGTETEDSCLRDDEITSDRSDHSFRLPVSGQGREEI